MAEPTDRTPFDDAFDAAFDHLMTCRAAYEANPRDPAHFAALGAARATLEDARTQMNEERHRLGLKEREVHVPPPLLVDSEGQHDWQGTQQS
jgi:hypothetical protein